MAAAADTNTLAKARIGILGASGYTGAELVRLLLRHPRAEIVLLTADRRAGQEMRQVFPQFSPYPLPKLVALDGIDWAAQNLDLVFCALPHATTQKVIAELLARAPRTRVVDLSADFRLHRSGRLCALVRPRAPCAAVAARGGLRLGRGLSRQGPKRAARRQSGLLHHLRAARRSFRCCANAPSIRTRS